MKRIVFFLLCILGLFTAASADDFNAQQQPQIVDSLELKPMGLWVPAAEVLGINLFVWSWDRYYLKVDYAKINLHTVKQNFRDGFTWDNNHFGINFFGHPYQGTYYYNAARSSGYSFTTSFLFTLAGSAQWEFFMEREQPSLNDLYTTSLGGAIYGEILYRLSTRMFEKSSGSRAYHYSAGTIFHPVNAVNRSAIGPRHNHREEPLKTSIALVSGRHLISNYRYQGEGNEQVEDEWKGKYAGVSLFVLYGSMGRKVQHPFDEFRLIIDHVADEDGKLINIETSGTLANKVIHSNPHTFGLAWKLNADVTYGNLASMSNYSTGPAFYFDIFFSDKIRIQTENSANWVFIGSTDFEYNNGLSDSTSTLDNEEISRPYQMSWGLSYKNLSVLEWINQGRIIGRMNLMGLRTMPKSEPHYGAYGWDILGIGRVSLEKYLPWNLSLGARMDVYWKMGVYKRMLPSARTMGSLGGYLQYNF